MYYFRLIDEPIYFMIDAAQNMMIKIHLGEQSATITNQWDKSVEKTLKSYLIDNLQNPLYDKVSEADFYLIYNKITQLTERNFLLFENNHFNN
jgi:hypothetical protein